MIFFKGISIGHPAVGQEVGSKTSSGDLSFSGNDELFLIHKETLLQPLSNITVYKWRLDDPEASSLSILMTVSNMLFSRHK